MTDTLIICLTVLIALGAVLGTWLYHQAQLRRTAVESVDLAGRLNSALANLQDIPRSVSALSERQVVLEGAIKNALAELVKVVGYSEAKHQQLIAKTVTAPRKPGQ